MQPLKAAMVKAKKQSLYYAIPCLSFALYDNIYVMCAQHTKKLRQNENVRTLVPQRREQDEWEEKR